MENPIYDVVDDDEYDALVAKRKEEDRDCITDGDGLGYDDEGEEEVRGFIIDDDGLGYGDEGEEEDWSRASRRRRTHAEQRKKLPLTHGDLQSHRPPPADCSRRH